VVIVAVSALNEYGRIGQALDVNVSIIIINMNPLKQKIVNFSLCEFKAKRFQHTSTNVFTAILYGSVSINIRKHAQTEAASVIRARICVAIDEHICG
jgi:hypothetical protein